MTADKILVACGTRPAPPVGVPLGDVVSILHTVFNYPTLAECYKVAALNAANKLSL